jgi:hypothetical protein
MSLGGLMSYPDQPLLNAAHAGAIDITPVVLAAGGLLTLACRGRSLVFDGNPLFEALALDSASAKFRPAGGALCHTTVSVLDGSATNQARFIVSKFLCVLEDHELIEEGSKE